MSRLLFFCFLRLKIQIVSVSFLCLLPQASKVLAFSQARRIILVKRTPRRVNAPAVSTIRQHTRSFRVRSLRRERLLAKKQIPLQVRESLGQGIVEYVVPDVRCRVTP